MNQGKSSESDSGFSVVGWGLQEWQEFLIDIPEGLIVLHEGLFDGGEAFLDGQVCQQLFAQIDESPDDEYAHADGVLAVQNVCSHQRTVFGEGVGKGFGKLEALKVVTVCDQLCLFFRG
jgi:hypothetical protein